MGDEAIENEVTTPQRSRRALLAKAAIASGVAYAAPIVSKVPAYAAPGLRSFKFQSSSLCMWFSPNQETFGNWHDMVPGGDTETAAPGPATVTVTLNGINRTVQFYGDPNNDPGAEGRGVAAEPFEWYGFKYGGVKITVVSAKCEVLVESVVCNASKQCGSSNQVAPASWAVGSSNSPIGLGVNPPTLANTAPGGIGYTNFTGSVYYHTGRTGRGDNDRCKWGIQYRIRCD